MTCMRCYARVLVHVPYFYVIVYYCIAHNGGMVNFRRIGNFKNLVGKPLPNCNI